MQEPGSKYIGCVTLYSGSAYDISSKIRTNFNDEIWQSIHGIGVDETNVNTDRKADKTEWGATHIHWQK